MVAVQPMSSGVRSFTRSEGEDSFTLTLFKGGAPGIGYQATAYLMGVAYAQEAFCAERGVADSFFEGTHYISGLMEKIGWQSNHPLQIKLVQLFSPFYKADNWPYIFNKHGICTNPEEIIVSGQLPTPKGVGLLQSKSN